MPFVRERLVLEEIILDDFSVDVVFKRNLCSGAGNISDNILVVDIFAPKQKRAMLITKSSGLKLFRIFPCTSAHGVA